MSAVQEVEKPTLEKYPEEPGELVQPRSEDELKGYLERVERTPGTQTVQDNTTSQTVLTAPVNQVAEITLPLTDEQINQGLKGKPDNSSFWLATWALRMIKQALLLGKKIIYPSFKTQ